MNNYEQNAFSLGMSVPLDLGNFLNINVTKLPSIYIRRKSDKTFEGYKSAHCAKILPTILLC